MDRKGSGFKKTIGDYKLQHNFTEDKTLKFFSDNDLFFGC